MGLDLILKNARIDGSSLSRQTYDIGISEGFIAAVEPDLATDRDDNSQIIDLKGCLVTPGLIETHIHLDKSRLLDRCSPPPPRKTDMMARIIAVKPGFTVEDIYRRAKQSLETCISHGTTSMRTHVEVDATSSMLGFEAIEQIAKDYRWAIDIDLCVFAQEGMTDNPVTDANVVEGLKRGARVIGGAPRYDSDRHGQIRRVFSLAREYDVDIDLHLDVGPDADELDVLLVCELTDEINWGGRVAVGHATKYASMQPGQLSDLGKRLSDTGITVTVLPATDLFIMGRERDHNVVRGVTDAHALIECGVNCCLSTNNILNPITPFGDGSLVRIAGLYANIVQRGTDAEMLECFEMLTHRPARLMGREDYGLSVGNMADIVVWNCDSRIQAIQTIAHPVMGFKRGRQTFTRSEVVLNRPD